MAKINTTDYENTHGRKPRGYGYWMIRIGSRKETFTGSYGEVIKNAKAATASWARRRSWSSRRGVRRRPKETTMTTTTKEQRTRTAILMLALQNAGAGRDGASGSGPLSSQRC